MSDQMGEMFREEMIATKLSLEAEEREIQRSLIVSAKAKGYEIIRASAFEVGLVKNGQGIRTWWTKDFGHKFPTLDHPIIQSTIKTHESIP